MTLARNESAEAVAGLQGAKATCVCWIGGQGICFAIGYSTSDICVWGLPLPVQQGRSSFQSLSHNVHASTQDMASTSATRTATFLLVMHLA